jgi:outer membrane protein assembly factor BamE (lipoprotein component of BamABCDE complex)
MESHACVFTGKEEIPVTSMKAIFSLAVALTLASCGGSALVAPTPPPTVEQFALVQIGMTRDDTLRILGKPYETMRFPLSGNEAWDYLYQDPWGYTAAYGVTFGRDGHVASKISRRLNDGGDHGSGK